MSIKQTQIIIYKQRDKKKKKTSPNSLRGFGHEKPNRGRHPGVRAPVPLDGDAHLQGQILLRRFAHQPQIRYDGRPLRSRVRIDKNIIRQSAENVSQPYTL